MRCADTLARMRVRVAVTLAAVMLLGCSSPVPPTASPSPSATASPAPTATTAPTASAAPTPGTVPSATPPLASPTGDHSFQALHVDEAAIDRHLDALAEIAEQHDGIRAAGTSGYDASADYVESVMA